MPFDDADSTLPEDLVADLHRLSGSVDVPAHRDAAVLAGARHHLRYRKTIVRVLRWTPLAAAAVLGLMVWTAGPVESPGPAVVVDRVDIDGNGRVDILDALALARRVEESTAVLAHDFNADGLVDRADVDTIAARAVAIQ